MTQNKGKEDFPKKYNPKQFEDKIYLEWEDNWKFIPKKSITKQNFYIPMPPPNVTSKLHVGHSIMLSLEDIMTRYHRMKWDSTLLLPWTDHAGIKNNRWAGQPVVCRRDKGQALSSRIYWRQIDRKLGRNQEIN